MKKLLVIIFILLGILRAKAQKTYNSYLVAGVGLNVVGIGMIVDGSERLRLEPKQRNVSFMGEADYNPKNVHNDKVLIVAGVGVFLLGVASDIICYRTTRVKITPNSITLKL